MTMEDLITVVVPVYNVEGYLDDCVASIGGQTYRNLEILLVDDGSTDSSGAMCDRWAERDSRIQVIHKENGGLSDARNTGIQQAHGAYLSFVDSDDLVEPHFLECMHRQAEASGAQITCCAFVRFEDGDTPPEEQPMKPWDVLDGSGMIRALYTGSYPAVGAIACNKLYRTELFRSTGIRYPKGKIYEDTFTTFRLFYHAETVAVTEQALYDYRTRSGSIMRRKINPAHCRDGIEADYSNVAFFQEKQERALAELALNAFFKSTIECYRRVSGDRADPESARCRRMYVTAFRQVWKKDRGWFRFGFVKMTAYRLFALIPDVAARLIP